MWNSNAWCIPSLQLNSSRQFTNRQSTRTSRVENAFIDCNVDVDVDTAYINAFRAAWCSRTYLKWNSFLLLFGDGARHVVFIFSRLFSISLTQVWAIDTGTSLYGTYRWDSLAGKAIELHDDWKVPLNKVNMVLQSNTYLSLFLCYVLCLMSFV